MSKHTTRKATAEGRHRTLAIKRARALKSLGVIA